MLLNALLQRYKKLLDGYLAGGDESHLAAASELGRELLAEDFPPEELAELHETAVAHLADEHPELTVKEAVHLLSAPLMEMFMAFGLAYRERIDAHRHAARVLREKSRELERSNAELEQFAYAVSHDLQEPLRTVSGFLQLLVRRHGEQFGSDAGDLVARAHLGTERMQRLIEGLLALSRVGRRGVAPDTSVSDVVEEVMLNLRQSLRESRAQVRRSALPRVKGDPVLLAQLFQNLLSNALKFRGEKAPRISIRARCEGRQWCFEVKDNGIGIAQEFQDAVFAIFRRAHSARRYPGTGIGLALCKKIVEQQGGRIWLESQVNKGTTFYFTLPAAGQPGSAALSKDAVMGQDS